MNAPDADGSVSGQTLKFAISEGSSSGDRVASIDLENVYYTSWSHPVSIGEDRVLVNVNAIGLAGLSDSSDKVPIRWYTV